MRVHFFAGAVGAPSPLQQKREVQKNVLRLLGSNPQNKIWDGQQAIDAIVNANPGFVQSQAEAVLRHLGNQSLVHLEEGPRQSIAQGRLWVTDLGRQTIDELEKSEQLRGAAEARF
jgi:hypothetical protein